MNFELNNAGGNKYIIFADLDDDQTYSAGDQALVQKNLHDDIF